MLNGVGRSFAELQSSATAVRAPHFQTAQHPLAKYQRMSVLDNLFPSGNGRSAGDRQRLLMGIEKSTIGQADSTFDQRLWLRSERPPSLFQQQN